MDDCARCDASLSHVVLLQRIWSLFTVLLKPTFKKMSNAEQLADQYEKENMQVGSLHGGKQRTKKEAEMNTNRQIPAGHERKIATKLMNADKNQKAAEHHNYDQEKQTEGQGKSKKEPVAFKANPSGHERKK